MDLLWELSKCMWCRELCVAQSDSHTVIHVVFFTANMLLFFIHSITMWVNTSFVWYLYFEMKRFCLLHRLVDYGYFSSMFPVPLIKWTSPSSQTPGYIPCPFGPSKSRQGSPVSVVPYVPHGQHMWRPLSTTWMHPFLSLLSDIRYDINSEQQYLLSICWVPRILPQILTLLYLIFLMYKLEIDSNLQC